MIILYNYNIIPKYNYYFLSLLLIPYFMRMPRKWKKNGWIRKFCHRKQYEKKKKINVPYMDTQPKIIVKTGATFYNGNDSSYPGEQGRMSILT